MQIIACDNDNGFSAHEEIYQISNTEIYFAHPYGSFERGLKRTKITQFAITILRDSIFDDDRIWTSSYRVSSTSRPRKCDDINQPMVILKIAIAGNIRI